MAVTRHGAKDRVLSGVCGASSGTATTESPWARSRRVIASPFPVEEPASLCLDLRASACCRACDAPLVPWRETVPLSFSAGTLTAQILRARGGARGPSGEPVRERVAAEPR